MKAFLTTLNPFLLTFCLFFFAPKPAFAILKPNGTVQTLQTAAPQKSNIQGFDLISSPDNTRLETILIIAALACYTSTF